MALCSLTRAFSSLAVSSHRVGPLLFSQTVLPSVLPSRGLPSTASASLSNNIAWKNRTKYTINPIGKKKTGGRDHTGRTERSADIALVAGGKRKRWIIATENMQEGDLLTSSGHIGRMAVSAKEGDAHPLGALPVGTLISNLEFQPGKGAQYIRAAGTSGVLLRKVNGTAIVQLPSKRQIQVMETCVATVGRVSNIDHNKRIIGKAGRNRWLGIRPSSGLWKRKGGWAGRKIKPLPGLKSYIQLPSALPAPR
ncbi:hypothetical protein XELAEV_18026440mg [Xenopus laevis]|uniref:Large ribosomal subunit protein uL2 C-terminal domain-containing protein n=1 Tax=Xenopus laevis TaxID=8355 RepID=A0A974CVP9_XENLA|nr:hypothetical protein XELAEV_18026440mg [Xenopus laevis]